MKALVIWTAIICPAFSSVIWRVISEVDNGVTTDAGSRIAVDIFQ